MRRSSLKFILSAAILLLAVGIIFTVVRIHNSALQTLADERARQMEQEIVPFEKKILTPFPTQKVRIVQNTKEVRDFVKFGDSYYAATDGGLAQFSLDGKPEKHFTVLDGLPESDLTSLAVYQNKLFIGTRTKNLVTFDGEKFENYVWTDRKAQSVTAFAESGGRLLIGTFGGGLLEYDGQNFREIKAHDQKIAGVTCIYKNAAKLYVGTFKDGLFTNETGTWKNFTTAEKLPSNCIVGIAVKDRNLYVATDFGLAILRDKIFEPISLLPALSSLVLANDGSLLLAKENGEIYNFDKSLKESSAKSDLHNAHLINRENQTRLLSDQGISNFENGKFASFTPAENNSLSDNFVSALAFDANENLWIGTFRHGIDIFSDGGEKLKHLESEEVREINFLAARGETVSAATSAGLINFKKDFSWENQTAKDNLPSASVTHFSADTLATGKGLAIYKNGHANVLSTVQKMPNNSVYTLLDAKQKLYAGTLGGLAEIENGRVVRVYQDSNSGLTTNWVTALCLVNDRIFIGTYGGGIFELLPSGEIHSFAPETGKFVVNPNALYSDGERLYAGTLEGIKVLNLQTQEWKNVRRILPSETVMSITGNSENIYFGTTNGIARIAKDYFINGEME